MLKFKVMGAFGASRQSNCREDFGGVQGLFIVAARDRVDAFIKLFRYLVHYGNDVTVLHVNGLVNPLNFSSADLAAIRAAGIPLKTGCPTDGFQIGDIVSA